MRGSSVSYREEPKEKEQSDKPEKIKDCCSLSLEDGHDKTDCKESYVGDEESECA